MTTNIGKHFQFHILTFMTRIGLRGSRNSHLSVILKMFGDPKPDGLSTTDLINLHHHHLVELQFRKKCDMSGYRS